VRVELGAASITVAPGGAVELTVEVFNERTVIDGVTARVMGLDAQWVKARPGRLALFPDTAGTIELRLTVPEEFPAGTHVVAVEVTSSVDPLDVVVVPLELVVRPATDAFVLLEPSRLVGRRHATFTATVENSGNTRLELALVASDPDRALAFTFDPKVVEVPPGEAVTSQVEVEARTRLFGSNLDRQFNVSASSRDAAYDAGGVFVHQPVVPRGVLTAAMLAAIVGLWALIFLVVLGTILDGEEPEKAAPASFFATSEEVLAASGGTSAQAKFVTPAMGASVAGVVVSTSTGEPVGRITVDAVRTTPDGPVTVASGASDDEGAYRLGGLPPGEYSVRFSAPGFEEVWYPAAPSRTGAQPFRVAAFEVVEGKDAEVTGLPGSLAGVVDTGAPLGTVPVSVDVRPVVGGVPGDVVATIGTDDQNAFAAAGLPTPGLYELTFSAAGYQPTTAVERLGGGENRLTTSIRLSAGDGSISGVVTDGLQPLGGVTITVTSGELNLTTATPTSGSVGRFSLTGLPTPATYLITFAREGFGFESVAVDLGPGQQRTDVDVELVRGTGSVTGRVTDSGGQGLGDVLVTVSGNGNTVTTSTLTAGGIGTYSVGGLSTPGRYTLTFQLDGYALQTVAVDLAASGFASGIDVVLSRTAATLSGTVLSCVNDAGLGGVQISLTDGQTGLSTTSATAPAGSYALSGLSPGSYAVSFTMAGYSTQTLLVEITAGASLTRDVTMQLSNGGCP
jgi:hypothetical protein